MTIRGKDSRPLKRAIRVLGNAFFAIFRRFRFFDFWEKIVGDLFCFFARLFWSTKLADQ